MDFDKIGGLLTAVAPNIATALGGPLAGLAVKTLSDVVLGHENGTETEIATALQSATPEQIASVKKIDADFAVRMKELDIDLEKLAVSDRSSARQREVDMKDWTPKVLAFTIIGGYFASLFWLLTKGMPTSGSESVIMMLGALSQIVTAIIAYYFGSSMGSREKDKFIEKKGMQK